MSGAEKMNAITNGHMASAAAVAQLTNGASAGSAAGVAAGGAARSTGARAELYSKDTLG